MRIRKNIVLGLRRMTVAALVCMGLSACVPPFFKLCLYNAQNIDVSIIGKGPYADDVHLSAPANELLNFEAGGRYRQFIMQTATGTYCYQVPATYQLSRRWVYRGFSRYHLAYAKLDNDNKIYLYDKTAHGGHAFYTTKVPDQPTGFPIEPTALSECA